MSVPKRLGLVTANKLAKKIIQLITKYRPVLVTILTSEEMTKVDNLVACCNVFIEDVPMYPTE